MKVEQLKLQAISQRIIPVSELPSLANCLSSLPQRFQRSYKRKVEDYDYHTVAVKVGSTTVVSMSLRLWNTIHSRCSLLDEFDSLIRARSFNPDSLVVWLSNINFKYKACDVGFKVSNELAGKQLGRWWVGAPLTVCHNNWSCSVCTPKGLWQHEQDIANYVSGFHRYVGGGRYEGINGFQWVFTIQHKFGDDLVKLFEVYRASLKMFKKTKTYKDFVKVCGCSWGGKLYVPVIKDGEVTLSHRGQQFDRDFKKYQKAQLAMSSPVDALFPRNDGYIRRMREDFAEDNAQAYANFHLHYHAIVFMPHDRFSAYEVMIPALKREWADSVIKATRDVLGRTLHYRQEDYLYSKALFCGTRVAETSKELVMRGLPAFGIEKELTRRTPDKVWSIEYEIANHTAKRSDKRVTRKNHLEPFELLDKPTIFFSELWRLYCLGTKGQQRFSLSKNIDKFFVYEKERQQRLRPCWEPASLAEALQSLIPANVTVQGLKSLLEKENSLKCAITLKAISRRRSRSRIIYGTFSPFCLPLSFFFLISLTFKGSQINVLLLFSRAKTTFP